MKMHMWKERKGEEERERGGEEVKREGSMRSADSRNKRVIRGKKRGRKREIIVEDHQWNVR